MCKAIEDLEKMHQALGADNAIINAIKNLMKNQRKSFEEVCMAMEISNVDMKRYKEMI